MKDHQNDVLGLNWRAEKFRAEKFTKNTKSFEDAKESDKTGRCLSEEDFSSSSIKWAVY